LLDIEAFESSIEHHRRSSRDKPARIEQKPVLEVHVSDNEVALETLIKRLGF